MRREPPPPIDDEMMTWKFRRPILDSLAVMLAPALPCHMRQQLIADEILTGRSALAPPINEHWESMQGSGAKLWFLRNQGSHHF